MWHFIKFLLLSLITFGIYPLYFYVTRQERTNELLEEILEKLKKKNLIITRIAQGVPAGGDLNYVDNNTLRRAISFRTELKWNHEY